MALVQGVNCGSSGAVYARSGRTREGTSGGMVFWEQRAEEQRDSRIMSCYVAVCAGIVSVHSSAFTGTYAVGASVSSILLYLHRAIDGVCGSSRSSGRLPLYTSGGLV